MRFVVSALCHLDDRRELLASSFRFLTPFEMTGALKCKREERECGRDCEEDEVLNRLMVGGVMSS